jgi:thiamine biosynthesis lipoprotein
MQRDEGAGRNRGWKSSMNRVLIPSHLDAASPPAPSMTMQHLRGETMGTTWSAKLFAPEKFSTAEIRAGIQRVLNQVVAQMSTWDADSDLSRFNSAAAGSMHSLPAEFFEVLCCALQIAEQSNGVYDPTIGPMVNLWGFGPEAQRTAPPSPTDIDVQRARCGWQRLQFDRANKTLRQPGDCYLDFSAIAKGFGVDQISEYLNGIGCSSYLVEVGGELRGMGMKPDRHPWWVALEQPPAQTLAQTPAQAPAQASSAKDPRPAQTIVALHRLSIATSGDYRRGFEWHAKRYSHSIDPRTGYPIDHGLASVSVLHPRCMMADALSTALTVLGAQHGLDYARRHDIAALFIERGEQGLIESMSPALTAMLAE